MEEKRSEFEKWAAIYDISLPLKKDRFGVYVKSATRWAEEAWKARGERDARIADRAGLPVFAAAIRAESGTAGTGTEEK
jgi:hypothetical protein